MGKLFFADDYVQRGRNHACRTVEQRQLSLLASSCFQDKIIGNYLPQTPKKVLEVGLVPEFVCSFVCLGCLVALSLWHVCLVLQGE